MDQRVTWTLFETPLPLFKGMVEVSKTGFIGRDEKNCLKNGKDRFKGRILFYFKQGRWYMLPYQLTSD